MDNRSILGNTNMRLLCVDGEDRGMSMKKIDRRL